VLGVVWDDGAPGGGAIAASSYEGIGALVTDLDIITVV
jgi:hypothetical protein